MKQTVKNYTGTQIIVLKMHYYCKLYLMNYYFT